MKKTILLLIASWLIFWLGGSWAFIFYRILQDGYVRLYEPNMVMLIAEFSVAILITLFSVGLFWWTIKKARREYE